MVSSSQEALRIDIIQAANFILHFPVLRTLFYFYYNTWLYFTLQHCGITLSKALSLSIHAPELWIEPSFPQERSSRIFFFFFRVTSSIPFNIYFVLPSFPGRCFSDLLFFLCLVLFFPAHILSLPHPAPPLPLSLCPSCSFSVVWYKINSMHYVCREGRHCSMVQKHAQLGDPRRVVDKQLAYPSPSVVLLINWTDGTIVTPSRPSGYRIP